MPSECSLTEQQCQWCRDGMKSCQEALAILERVRKTGDDVEEAIAQVQKRHAILQGYLAEFGPSIDTPAPVQ